MNVEPWIVLSQGTSGYAVRGMQHLLRAHGSDIAATGDFDAATEAAVRSFQTAGGLPVNGRVDVNTWAHLVIDTSPGSTGDAVRGVQSFELVLIPGQEPLLVDGVYGTETEARVSLFQNLWGLGGDGVAARGTWAFFAADKRTVWPLVRIGASEPDDFRVRPVQHLLRARGFDVTVDGQYGPETAEAVRQFTLSRRAVDVDSVVGNLTWPALIVPVAPGDTGEAVSAVQTLLPQLTVDGDYGSHTESAVTKFQEMWGLEPDGIVGPLTWRTLVIPKFD
jgi:peptidoglycan hydrolase-like protein with peptidoglycan-binding domain